MIQPTPVRDQFTICTQDCRGACCRYITVPIDAPTCHDDWDEMRWWLAHEGISISKDEDGWAMLVPAKCKNLRADNACAIYPHHMETCKEYDAADCEFTGPIENDEEFHSESDLGDYLERRKLKRGAKVLAAIRAAETQRPENADRGLVQMQLLAT